MAKYETYPRSLWHSVRKDKPMTEQETQDLEVSNLEVARSAEEVRKLTNYERQESRRAPKVQIDQRLVLWSWIVGIAIAFLASAIVSFNGITSVAFFVGLSQDWMAGLFFFFIELMYLLFLIAYLVLASRVDEDGKKEKTWVRSWVW